MFSPLTKQLIESLQALPGVGPKTAQRMAFQMLAQTGRRKGLVLADALQKALSEVDYCQRCRIYTEQSLCDICQNPKRDERIICVAENPADVMAIEQTNSFRGLYYVLHGYLSPLDGIGPNEIGIPELLNRLEKEPVTELIIATNPTIEGKATAHYLANHINHKKIKCSRIAHGVPIGGELEYLDGGTLALAFESRVVMES